MGHWTLSASEQGCQCPFSNSSPEQIVDIGLGIIYCLLPVNSSKFSWLCSGLDAILNYLALFAFYLHVYRGQRESKIPGEKLYFTLETWRILCFPRRETKSGWFLRLGYNTITEASVAKIMPSSTSARYVKLLDTNFHLQEVTCSPIKNYCFHAVVIKISCCRNICRSGCM